MVWTQLKLLLPSYVGYWVFMMAILTTAHFVISRNFPRIPFKWMVPVTVSTAIVAIMVANTVLSTVQGVAIYQYQQNQKTQTAAATADTAKPVGDAGTQMKAEFLKTVEQIASNPDQLTDDVKGKIFAHFGSLFAKPSDK